jgi:small subunit ribosomal protein S17
MKIFTGKVIAAKTPKTLTVLVNRILVHPLYKKRIWVSRKYLVHDEIGTEVGRTVKFVAGRPYSKLKKWKVMEIVELGKDKKDKSELRNSKLK